LSNHTVLLPLYFTSFIWVFNTIAKLIKSYPALNKMTETSPTSEKQAQNPSQITGLVRGAQRIAVALFAVTGLAVATAHEASAQTPICRYPNGALADCNSGPQVTRIREHWSNNRVEETTYSETQVCRSYGRSYECRPVERSESGFERRSSSYDRTVEQIFGPNPWGP
jgi:hypothetical protein